MSSRPRTTAALACALAALATASCARFSDLPRLRRADLARIELAQSSKIYDRDGNLITTLHGEQDRTIIPLGRIPKKVRQAVVAIEDERFYEHGGVDWQAIGRALLANVSSGEIREGGSTITQQYVKNTIIAPNGFAEKTFDRKLTEAALARQLERKLSKNEILERYLNTVYYGQGAYGIQAAAKTYFGRPARKLTLAQGALLAGLIRAPEDYDPYDAPAAARERRNVVLRKMFELGMIGEERLAVATGKRLGLQKTKEKDRYAAPYFVDYVQRLISYDPRFHVVGRTLAQRTKRLFSGGLRIYTTVDLEMQEAAEAAIAEQLPLATDPYASLVALEPSTGEVRAMVGGRDWFAPRREDRFAKLNLAILAEPELGCVRNARNKCKNPLELGPAPGTGRQAGSAFKPFALTAAIEEGIPLSKTYRAQPCMTFPGANAGEDWRVCNYEESSFGSSLPLLEATVKSVNVVYAQLIMDVGPEAVVAAAREMGIRTPLAEVPSAALGTSPVNPLGMASAYGTLANNGTYEPPVAITRIVDSSNGKVVYDASTDETLAGREAVPASVAQLTTSALEQVIQRGTGVNADIGRPAAGKTGTAQEYRDAWFVGYTPDLVASVWVGYPEGEIEMKPSCYGSIQPCRPTRTLSAGGVTGGSWPALIWRSFMLRALAETPATDFPTSELGSITVTIDTRTGCLADRFTPEEYREERTVPTGTEPIESCRVDEEGVLVPDVFGFPVEDAVRTLEGAGFSVVQQQEPTSTYPPGRVVRQTPAGGQRAREGSTVVIYVSVRAGRAQRPENDSTTVPNVLGYTEGAAEASLRNAGFRVDVIYQRESDRQQAKRRKGRVWKQSPAGGSEAREGSTVTIWVNP